MPWWLSNRHVEDVDTSPNRWLNVVDSQSWIGSLFYNFILSLTLVVVVEVKGMSFKKRELIGR
jgi:uncharacterized membrane protein